MSHIGDDFPFYSRPLDKGTLSSLRFHYKVCLQLQYWRRRRHSLSRKPWKGSGPKISWVWLSDEKGLHACAQYILYCMEEGGRVQWYWWLAEANIAQNAPPLKKERLLLCEESLLVPILTKIQSSFFQSLISNLLFSLVLSCKETSSFLTCSVGRVLVPKTPWLGLLTMELLCWKGGRGK